MSIEKGRNYIIRKSSMKKVDLEVMELKEIRIDEMITKSVKFSRFNELNYVN
jgi:hypothetical protein